jgi:predicted anti-sigma-YlaC factor YlaD
MKVTSCRDIEERLVAYSDGDLTGELKSGIDGHLAQCPDCRELLCCLNRSLDLTQILWQDNLNDVLEPSSAQRLSPRVSRVLHYVGIAAAVLIVVTIGLWSAKKRPGKSLSLAQVQLKMEEAARAARLLAAVDLLADRPDYADIVQQKYQYIVKVFPSTPSAQTAQTRLKTF